MSNTDTDTMWQRFVALLKWLYNWVTVLVATAVGALSYGVDAINAIIGTTDISPLFTPETAVKVVTGIAILKGLHAWYQSRKAA